MLSRPKQEGPAFSPQSLERTKTIKTPHDDIQHEPGGCAYFTVANAGQDATLALARP